MIEQPSRTVRVYRNKTIQKKRGRGISAIFSAQLGCSDTIFEHGDVEKKNDDVDFNDTALMNGQRPDGAGDHTRTTRKKWINTVNPSPLPRMTMSYCPFFFLRFYLSSDLNWCVCKFFYGLICTWDGKVVYDIFPVVRNDVVFKLLHIKNSIEALYNTSLLIKWLNREYFD